MTRKKNRSCGFTPLDLSLRQRKLKKGQTGFTIIELIMVIVILGILAGIGLPLVIGLLDSFQYVLYRKDLSETAEVALRRICREIPRLKDEVSVFTANATTYRFIDKDNNTLQFRINGNNLERELNGITDTLASNVLSFSYSYLDDQGSYIILPKVSPQRTNIKFIEIYMRLASGNNIINYRTRVRLNSIIHYSDLFS